MIRRFLELCAAAFLLAACVGVPSGVIPSAGPSTSSPDGRMRFDVGSVLVNEVTLPAQSLPHGQNVAAAVLNGTARGAGRRTMVLMIWGAPDMPFSDLVVYDNRAPYTGRLPVAVTEIPPTMAPQFDPSHAPRGTPRAFRFSYEGPMVSFELPRALLARGITTLLCPDGPSVYPDRVTVRSDGTRVQNGLWHSDEMNKRLADPRWTYSTTRPVVWQF